MSSHVKPLSSKASLPAESSVFPIGKVQSGNVREASGMPLISHGDVSFKGSLKAAKKAEAKRRKIKKSSHRGPAIDTGGHFQAMLVPNGKAVKHLHKNPGIDDGGKVKDRRNVAGIGKVTGKRERVLQQIQRGKPLPKRVPSGAVKEVKGGAPEKGAKALLKDDFIGRIPLHTTAKVKGGSNVAGKEKAVVKQKRILTEVLRGNSIPGKPPSVAVKEVMEKALKKGAKVMVKDDFVRQMPHGKEISHSGRTHSKSGGDAAKRGLPKIPAGAIRESILTPLKAAALKGASKKGRRAVEERRAGKKGARGTSASKHRALTGAALSEGRAAKENLPFPETLKSANGEGDVKFLNGFRLISSVTAERANGGAPAGPLSGQGRKAVFSDSAALLNMSASAVAPQSRSRTFPANLKGAMEGRGEQMIKQAADGLVMSLRKGDREIVLNLEPAELGHLEIKVTLHHGLVDASIVVENADVMAMLNANTASLKEQLAGQGFMLGGLEVALKGSDTPARQKGGQFGGHGGHYGRGESGLMRAAPAGEEMPLAVKALNGPMPAGALDLFI